MSLESLQWLMCFFSMLMILLQQWALMLGVSWSGTLVTLLFLLPWVMFFALRPSAAIVSLVPGWPLLALPLLCIFSAAWSDYPAWTLRAGIQFLITIMIGIWMATWVKPRTFLSALLIALASVTFLSALKDIFGSFRGSFTGLFGSKNYFALCVSLMLLLALTVTPSRSQSLLIRRIALAAVMSAPPLLVLAQSTGALLFSAATIAIIAVLAVAARLPPRIRSASLVLLFLSGLTIALCASLYFRDISDVLDSVGKDSTFTGRTLLWDAAQRTISDYPILGVGYQAFWQQGNWGAEVLWQASYITSRTGYHFHNTYFQIAVDLGIVGLLIFFGIIISLILKLALVFLLNKPRAEQMFAAAIVIFFLLRTPIEVDLFFQFQIGSILVCSAWVYLKVPKRQSTVGRSGPVGYAATDT
jgi:exopolysaccharide production protein ExoQ